MYRMGRILSPSRAERGMYLGISGTISAEYSRNG